MKKLLLTLSLISICFFAFAQKQPAVGDKLAIKEPSGQFYNHIAFPQLNILVKRGKVASYKPVIGNEVLVDEVKTRKNKTHITLKRKDGSEFFGLYSTVKAKYEDALEAGELALVSE